MTPSLGYTKMKDSGIATFGMVPAHWGVHRFQNLCTLRNEENTGGRGLLSVYLDKGVIRYSDSTRMQVHKPSDSLDKYQNVYIGDFVLNNQQAWRGSVGVSQYDGIISPAYFVYKLSAQCVPSYMNYLVRDICMVQQYELASRGVGTIQRNIYEPWLKKARFVLPPVNEQTAIAAYLDVQCAKIDEVIAEAKASIEDYKKWKASTIYEAVTKGLNPDVEMKESGIYWIGKIPKQWGLKRLKYMFAIKKDIAGKIGYTILAITQQGVKPKNMSDKGQFALDYSKYQIVNPGDFAMNHMDLLTGWVDISKFAGVTSPDYRVFYPLTPDEIDADYYKHLFQTCYLCRIFYGLGQGVSGFGRWRLPAEMFLNFVLPVPPLDEQKEIAAFLEKQCSQIDGIIAEKEALVSDLESYKKSLIYEVVTGKRRVSAPSEATVVAVHPSVLGYQKALLMCRVLDLLGDDTRGRIHVQKCLFAIECLLEMPFQTQYVRYEHGPYDTHINDCEALIVENDWFTIQNGSPVIYKKGAHFNAYLDEYMKVFADMDSKIKEIVEFLKPMKTSQAERIATLLAAWNDFILDGTAEPTDQQIVNEVMTNWTPNKANTQLLTWQNSMDKLKQSGFVPAGLGVHTIKKEAQEV